MQAKGTLEAYVCFMCEVLVCVQPLSDSQPFSDSQDKSDSSSPPVAIRLSAVIWQSATVYRNKADK